MKYRLVNAAFFFVLIGAISYLLLILLGFVLNALGLQEPVCCKALIAVLITSVVAFLACWIRNCYKQSQSKKKE